VIINFQISNKFSQPIYAHPGDAGLDLTSTESFTIPPLSRVLCPTGISVEIPEGFVGLIHPRSGLALQKGLTVLNAPGTIDSNYRGEIQVILYNSDPKTPTHIQAGDRIAQLLIQKIETIQANVVDKLSDSVRGSDGFGSSGQ
jgi:dUTP pyrophosphatase